MCGICGCGQPEKSVNFKPVAGPQNYVVQIGHPHHAHGETEPERLIKIELDLLDKNNALAAQNRTYFEEHGIFALNLVSSPGSGKTALLVETINRLKDRFSIAVIEGDQQTDRDAERIRASGAPALQINTGKLCHLEAKLIGDAVRQLGVKDNSLLFIENIGNLVCPSAFDLGEAHKVVILSVTEGDDKPLKYPDMFRAADLMIINKIDLLPYVDFDVARCIGFAEQVNPEIEVVQLSARTQENFSAWLTWLDALAGR